MALAARKQITKTKPAFDRWLDGLSAANRAVVLGWLEDTTIANIRVAEWIREDDEEDDFKGYPANKDTIAIARARRGIERTS